MKKSRTYGENKTIDRVRCAESHGAHGKVTALKKRWVIAKKQKISYMIKYVSKKKRVSREGAVGMAVMYLGRRKLRPPLPKS